NAGNRPRAKSTNDCVMRPQQFFRTPPRRRRRSPATIGIDGQLAGADDVARPGAIEPFFAVTIFIAVLGPILSTRMLVSPLPGATQAPLDSIIITEELDFRPPRVRDPEDEREAIQELWGEVAVAGNAADASRVLQRIVDAALRLCAAGSAGVSVLEHD